MGFMDSPFVSRDGESRDPRRFPGHREVLMYLQDFAKEFRIEEMVRFNCEVISVELIDNDNEGIKIGRWEVKSKAKNDFVHVEIFDAVVVCNGHYTQPRIAEIPGVDLWPGKQMHSHNYRTPESFRDQAVRAADLSIEIAGIATEVHIASRSVPKDTFEKQHGYNNMWLHSMIESSHEDGNVVFQDGSAVLADIIFHCTGYKYHFTFLKTKGIVTIDDNRVGPLYKHVFPPFLAPGLSFVGIPFKVFLFSSFEYQSKWIACVLSGRISLPSQEEMMEDISTLYLTLEASKVSKRDTHNVGNYQAEYINWIAAQCQCPSFEEWREEMYYLTSKNWIARPKTYRDEWEDDHLMLKARQDFRKYTPKCISKQMS